MLIYSDTVLIDSFQVKTWPGLRIFKQIAKALISAFAGCTYHIVEILCHGSHGYLVFYFAKCEQL